MKKIALFLAAPLALLPVAALATPPEGVDYSALTDAVSFDTTIAAILAIGALAIVLTLTVTGIRKVIRMVRSA